MDLKDLLPREMQRLTKYPLFIDSLIKHTARQSYCLLLSLEITVKTVVIIKLREQNYGSTSCCISHGTSQWERAIFDPTALRPLNRFL